MNSLLEELKAGKILLGDGAMGTSLQQRGLGPGQCPESWNITRASEVEEIIASYAAAGSDIVKSR